MAEAALPALVGGAVSALGSYVGSQTSANALRQSAALQQERYNQAVGYQQPYLTSGTNALAQYNNAIGTNGTAAQQAYYDTFQNDPGYQSTVNYGLNQIQANSAAQGMGLSGNTLAALQDYSQKSLSSEYQTRLQDLLQVAQLGQSSANSLTSATTASASSQGATNNLIAQYLGNSLSSSGNSLASAANNYSNYYYGTQQRSL